MADIERIGYYDADQLAEAVTDPLSATFQAKSASLTALAALPDIVGVVERTGPDTFTIRMIGVGSADSLLTRANGDARYAGAGSGVLSFNTRTGAVTLSSADVTDALTYTPTSVTGLTGVQSVAAFKTGLTLAKGDVGLGSVDNTADAAKNVLTATKLATARTISISGDMTWSSGSFDGSANVTAAGTLATVNSNVGTFGSATQVPQLTVNGKGLITAVSNITIAPAASSITGGQALTRTNDTNVTLTLGGTPATALLVAASLTLGWTGTLAVARGGTGGGTASGTLLDNITGFSSTGIVNRTGAGAYGFLTAPAGTIVGTSDTQTLTNKTLSSPTYTGTGSGDIKTTGGVYADSTQGFVSTTYTGNARNPIWYFGNATTYGLSYFQGTAGIGALDVVGVHFGTATAAGSQFQIFQNGDIRALGVGRFASLRTDQTPTAAAVAQTHWVPVNINGTTYKWLLAS